MNTAAEAAERTVQVGDVVLYTSTDGTAHPALVTVTAETYDPGRAGYGMTAPQEGEVSLLVWRVSGRTYVRHNVPQMGSPAHEARLAEAEHSLPTDEGEPVTLASPVRYWQFRA